MYIVNVNDIKWMQLGSKINSDFHTAPSYLAYVYVHDPLSSIVTKYFTTKNPTWELSIVEKLTINPEEPAIEVGAPEDINGYQPMPYPEERPYSQFKKNGFVTANKAGVPVYYYDYM